MVVPLDKIKELGFRRYFPTSQCGKDPVVKWKHHQKRDNTEAENARYAECVTRGHGLALLSDGHLFAIDTDTAEGEAWVQDLDLPRTFTVKTVRGHHRWFKSSSVEVPTSVSKIAPGVDVLGKDHYGMAPGSTHDSGALYEIGVDAPIADAPRKLLALVTRKRRQTTYTASLQETNGAQHADDHPYAIGALASASKRVREARAGTRNTTLNNETLSVAGFVKSGLLSGDRLRAAMLRAMVDNNYISEHGEAAALKTIASALSAAQPREVPERHSSRRSKRSTVSSAKGEDTKVKDEFDEHDCQSACNFDPRSASKIDPHDWVMSLCPEAMRGALA